MNDTEQFESLKKRVDALKVKKLAAEAEKKRLEEELNNCKEEIKSAYGVEISDFASAIETMKNEYRQKMEKLSEMVEEAESKVERK